MSQSANREHGYVVSIRRNNETDISGTDTDNFTVINFTNSEVEYDPGCLGDAGCILSTHENTEKGVLHPYEAVVYE